MPTSEHDVLISTLRDTALVEVLDRHLGEGSGASLGAVFARGAAALEAERLVMPVVGVQGAGKSTFLNGLCFDRVVLPIEGDETTAVPTEIAYTSGETTAKVVFRDGRELSVAATEAGLRPWVDNELNPGNEKGVSRVVVETNAPLLRDGLVLVDLPGTGSLTPENLETTRTYLESAVGMVYLLRSVPPLTERESIFLAACWPTLPGAVFVQNQWMGESDEEVEDGRDYSLAKLGDLARKHRIPVGDGLRIVVANAYRGHEGALRGDAGMRDRSGMPACEQALREAASDWHAKLRGSWTLAVRGHVAHAEGLIATRLSSFEEESQVVRERMQDERRRFDAYHAELTSRSRAADDLLETFERDVSAWIEAWGRQSNARLKEEMQDLMRSGVVDGPNLSSALQDKQSDEIDELLAGCQDRWAALYGRLVENFADLVCPVSVRPGNLPTVNIESSRKLEAVLPAAGGLGGGLALGAGLGAVAGPVGAVLGGVAGMLLGSWLGGKAKSKITHGRAHKSEVVVFEAIDTFTRQVASELAETTRASVRALREAVTDSLRDQRDDFEAGHRRRLADLEAPRKERARIAADLRKDLALLRNKVSLLDGETA